MKPLGNTGFLQLDRPASSTNIPLDSGGHQVQARVGRRPLPRSHANGREVLAWEVPARREGKASGARRVCTGAARPSPVTAATKSVRSCATAKTRCLSGVRTSWLQTCSRTIASRAPRANGWAGRLAEEGSALRPSPKQRTRGCSKPMRSLVLAFVQWSRFLRARFWP